MRRSGTLLLLILPFFYLVISWRAALHFPAAWIQVDPDFSYLMNSFLLASGKAPHIAGQPGIFLEILGCVLAWLKGHLLPSSSAGLPDDFLLYAHHYYLLIRNVFLLLNCAALFHFGRFFLGRGVPVFHVIFGQALFFLSPLSWEFSGRICPEALIIFFTAYFAIFLQSAEGRQWWKLPVFVTLSLSAQFFFAPLVAGTLAIRSRKHCALAFGLTTLAFCALWFWGGTAHENGSFQPAENLKRALSLLAKDPTYALLLPFVAGIAFLGTALGRPEAPRGKRLLQLLALAYFAGFLFVLIRPVHASFFLPTIALVPAIFLHLCLAAPIRVARLPMGVLGVLLVWGLAQSLISAAAKQDLDSIHAMDGSRMESLVKKHADCRVVLAGVVPRPESALFAGNSGAASAWTEDLARLYPHVSFWAGGNRFRSFTAIWDERDWRRYFSGGCLLLFTAVPEVKFLVDLSRSRPAEIFHAGLTIAYLYR